MHAMQQTRAPTPMTKVWATPNPSIADPTPASITSNRHHRAPVSVARDLLLSDRVHAGARPPVRAHFAADHPDYY